MRRLMPETGMRVVEVKVMRNAPMTGARRRTAVRRPEAMNPVVYFESDWGSEEWTRGAYAASFDLGGLSRYGKYLRENVGPLHFACSDLAGAGYQHVDGAIRMGRLVASQVIDEVRA